MPPSASPRLLNVAHSVSIHATIPASGAEGALFTVGGNDGGFCFYIKDGQLTYGYNYVADQRFVVRADGKVPAGDHILSFEFEPTGKPDIAKGRGAPGTITLLVDGDPIANITLIEDPAKNFVVIMKDGKIYKNALSKC